MKLFRLEAVAQQSVLLACLGGEVARDPSTNRRLGLRRLAEAWLGPLHAQLRLRFAGPVLAFAFDVNMSQHAPMCRRSVRSQLFTTHWPAAVLHGALPHHGQALNNSLYCCQGFTEGHELHRQSCIQ